MPMASATDEVCSRCARGRECSEHMYVDANAKLAALPAAGAGVRASSSTGLKLLSDQQMQQFIVDGYLVVPPPAHLGPWFHQHVFDRCEASGHHMMGHNPGNNVLATMPELTHMLESPEVAGALQSVVGVGYAMSGHRYCHHTSPGSSDQNWHKDAYASGYARRHFRPCNVMLMYYPGAVRRELGPTAIIAGSQYFSMHSHHEMVSGSARADAACNDDGMLPAPPPAWGERMHLTTAAPGTCVLIHYDIWHKATANTSQATNRYMFKFQFHRTSMPGSRAPAWDHTSTEWVLRTEHTLNRPIALKMLWLSVWHWYAAMGHGSQGETATTATDTDTDTAHAHARLLGGTHERQPCKATHECVGTVVLAAASDAKTQKAVAAVVEDTETAAFSAALCLATTADGVSTLIDLLDATAGAETPASDAARRRAADVLATVVVPTAMVVARVLRTLVRTPSGCSRARGIHASHMSHMSYASGDDDVGALAWEYTVFVLGEWAPFLGDLVVPVAEVLAAAWEEHPSAVVRSHIAASLGKMVHLLDGTALLVGLVDTMCARILVEKNGPALQATLLALLHVPQAVFTGIVLPTVVRALHHAIVGGVDRYGRSLAIEALTRIGTKEDLLKVLLPSLWCPLTSQASPY